MQSLQKRKMGNARALDSATIKQISGRAGRYGLGSGSGLVTCLQQFDYKILREALATPDNDDRSAKLQPMSNVMEALVALVPGKNFSTTLLRLYAFARMDNDSFGFPMYRNLIVHIL